MQVLLAHNWQSTKRSRSVFCRGLDEQQLHDASWYTGCIVVEVVVGIDTEVCGLLIGMAWRRVFAGGGVSFRGMDADLATVGYL